MNEISEEERYRVISHLSSDTRRLPHEHVAKVLESFMDFERILGITLGASEEGNQHHVIHYNNIAFSHFRFLETMKLILAFRNCRTFLDVGCGFGMKPVLAKRLSYNLDCSGIEINPAYAMIAKNMGVKVEQMDALEYTNYDKHDIIYWYTPIRDSKLMNDLEKKIFTEANPKAILFPACFWKSMATDLGWKRGDGFYYKDV